MVNQDHAQKYGSKAVCFLNVTDLGLQEHTLNIPFTLYFESLLPQSMKVFGKVGVINLSVPGTYSCSVLVCDSTVQLHST